jgi:hypothetical protein
MGQGISLLESLPTPNAQEIGKIEQLYKHDRDTARLGATVSAFVGGATLAAAGTQWGNAKSLKFSFLLNMVALTYFSRLWASTTPVTQRTEPEKWLPWICGFGAQSLLVYSTTETLVYELFPNKHLLARGIGVGVCALVFVPAAVDLWYNQKKERAHLKKIIELSNAQTNRQ